MSMSVLLTLMAVTKSVPTPLVHFSVAAIVDTHSPAMEGLAWISMSVQLAHTTASNTVSILLEDSDVNATQDSN